MILMNKLKISIIGSSQDTIFFIERSKHLPGSTPLYDLALSFVASSDDPISGGRHKVIGSKELNIPPQTSTIASHLPKAVGAAFSIDRAKDLNFNQKRFKKNSLTICIHVYLCNLFFNFYFILIQVLFCLFKFLLIMFNVQYNTVLGIV